MKIVGAFLFGVWIIFFLMFEAGLETILVSARWAEKYCIMRLEAGADYGIAHL